MNREILGKLIDDVGSNITSGNRHNVWFSCNVLSDQLSKINPENMSPPEVATAFMQASKEIDNWAKDIRFARFSKWEMLSNSLSQGIKSYVEPEMPTSSSAFIRAVLGNEFVDVFGDKFSRDILTYYNSEKEGDIEWKREKLTSLWRFFEVNRLFFTKENPVFSQIIGQISNEFSIRHENKSQKTDVFLNNHTERDYERLLDSLFSVMITLFAYHNLITFTKQRIDSLLHSVDC